MPIQSLIVAHIQCTITVHYIPEYNHLQYHIYNVPQLYISYVNTIIDSITYTMYLSCTSHMSIQSLTTSHTILVQHYKLNNTV